MCKSVLIDAPPTLLQGLIPEICDGHTGEYDTEYCCDEPKNHEDAGEDREHSGFTRREDSVVEEKDA